MPKLKENEAVLLQESPSLTPVQLDAVQGKHSQLRGCIALERNAIFVMPPPNLNNQPEDVS